MDEIKNMIAKGEYDFYGIRMDDATYQIGDICNKSHNWWQDDPADGSEYNDIMGCWDGGELDGTCAFAVTLDNLVDAVREAKSSFGYYDNLYLIAGDYANGGNDVGEIVIQDAKVLYRFKIR